MIAAVLRIGLVRARQCGLLLVLAYVFNVVLALPLAAAVAVELEASIGSSIVGETMLRGFDHQWYRGFHVRAHGLGATFEPGVVGIGGVLKSLDGLVTGSLMGLHPTIVGAGILYLVGWVFLTSGFLARFAGEERFFAGAARHFPRVAILAACSWLLFVIAFKSLLPLLADIVEYATYDTNDERVHFAWTLGKYVVLWASLVVVALVFDYAKVAAVVHANRPLHAAFGRGVLFVLLHPRAVFGLAAALLALGLALLLLYALIAPGAGQNNGFKLGIAFVISQTYVFGRVALRCVGIAARTELVAKHD